MTIDDVMGLMVHTTSTVSLFQIVILTYGMILASVIGRWKFAYIYMYP